MSEDDERGDRQPTKDSRRSQEQESDEMEDQVWAKRCEDHHGSASFSDFDA